MMPAKATGFSASQIIRFSLDKTVRFSIKGRKGLSFSGSLNHNPVLDQSIIIKSMKRLARFKKNIVCDINLTLLMLLTPETKSL